MRGDRRRRLLADELTNPTDWPTNEESTDEETSVVAAKPGHYGDAQFLHEQPQLFDLIPRRPLHIVLMLFGLAIVAVGLEVGYAWMVGRLADGGSAVAALDLGGKGCLGRWFSSLVLLGATVATALIYAVRRHRTDDYQGQYRIWLWATACWFLLATDQAGSLREAFRDAMVALAGTALAGSGDLWWVILGVLGLGALGSRIFVDMHRDYLATVFLAIAAILLGVGVAFGLNWFPSSDAGRRVLIAAGCEMASYILLLGAMTLHARRVLFDALGLLPQAEPEAGQSEETSDKAESAPDEDDSDTAPEPRITRYDPKQATPQPPHASVANNLTATASSPANHKLSKSERKALKERLLRERAARRG